MIPVNLIATIAIAGMVMYSRYAVDKMVRTPHDGLQMDMTKQPGKHWFKHMVKPGEVNGEYYVMQEFIAAGEKGFYPDKSGSPPMHVHVYQEEEFTVVHGDFAYILNGKEYHAKEGETAVIPVGAEHVFWNPSPEKDLLISVKLTPGLHSDLFFENFAGVMRDSDKDGRSANPLHVLGLLTAYDLLLAELPYLVRKPFLDLIYHIAPVFGYKYRYTIYGNLSVRQAGINAAGEISPEAATTESTDDAEEVHVEL